MLLLILLGEWKGNIMSIFQNHTQYDFDYSVFGMSGNEFWNSLDHDFWANLEMLPWAEELLDYLEPFKPCILSSPAGATASGKQRWIKKHLPKFWNDGRYLLGPAKHYAASPEAILIDDHEVKIQEFKDAGGRGILFPAPWNDLRALADSPVIPVINILLDIASKDLTLFSKQTWGWHKMAKG